MTLVRNHDIDRGQANNRGITDPGGRNTFGVGWNESVQTLDRTDVNLAYAYILGREDGFPYVFVDMKELPSGRQDDRDDDEFVVAAMRFHNLSLAGQGGVPRREDIWLIEMPNAIGWQRGTDRLVIINKAAERFPIVNLATSLQPGEYKEVRTGWRLDVQPSGTIQHWSVPERSGRNRIEGLCRCFRRSQHLVGIGLKTRSNGRFHHMWAVAGARGISL